MAVPLRGGGGEGANGQPLRILFFFHFFYINKKVPTAIKLEGEEGKALMAPPLRFFFFFKFLRLHILPERGFNTVEITRKS